MSIPPLRNFIDGDFVEATAESSFDLIDPATEEVYGSSPVSSAADVDSAYRAEAKALERAWDMLDFLPKPEPTTKFSERTLSKIPPVPTGRRPPPLPGQREWWFWPAVAGGWAVAFFFTIGMSYRASAWVAPREPGEADLVRDLRLIENKKAYDNVEDFEFLRQLEHPDLFGEDGGS